MELSNNLHPYYTPLLIDLSMFNMNDLKNQFSSIRSKLTPDESHITLLTEIFISYLLVHATQLLEFIDDIFHDCNVVGIDDPVFKSSLRPVPG